MRRLVFNVSIILLLGIALIGCSEKEENGGNVEKNNEVVAVENKKSNVTNSSRELKDITDEEILKTIKEAHELYNKIYSAFDMDDWVETYIPWGIGDYPTSMFYRTKEPYETPEKREQALKDYYVDYTMLSQVIDATSKYGVDKLMERDNVYYFCPFQLNPSSIANYYEVISREIKEDTLKVNVKREYMNSYSNKDFYFVLDNDKLKLSNILTKNLNGDQYSSVKTSIKEKVNSLFSSIQGKYSVAFKDISEQDNLSINNIKAPAASTIKIFIMIETYNQVNKGKLILKDTVVLNDLMKVEGSGKLYKEPSGKVITIEELVQLMMVESDNTAANILIDKLGMSNINSTIKLLGCTNTELNRKMMDTDAINKGIDNYTSVDDLCLTLSKLYNNECIGSSYDSKMLDIMKKHQLKSKIPNELPEGVVVAHKSGEMGGIENDAAIVYTDKGAYILCILTNNGTSTEQVMAISDISREIYDKYMEYKGD